MMLSSCGGGSVATTAGDQTRFRSNPVPLEIQLGTDALGGRRNLSIRAFAACRTDHCPPEIVEISFTNEGTSPLRGHYDALRLVAGPLILTWDNLQSRLSTQGTIPTGEFIRVEVPLDFFRRLAYDPEARVELGSLRFRVDHGRRGTLRQMAAAMGLEPPGAEEPVIVLPGGGGG
jgi:hypothetical protein